MVQDYTVTYTDSYSPGVDKAVGRRLERAAAQVDRARGQLESEIVAAFVGGATLREIARSVGLTHPTVKAMIDKHVTEHGSVDEIRQRLAERARAAEEHTLPVR